MAPKLAKSRCRPKTVPSQDENEWWAQPFPTSGPLFDNLDLPKPELVRRIGRLAGRIRSYKMISIYQDRKGLLEQRGSAPNFQGGCLTLCTCVHQIRAEKTPEDWLNDWWFAGFTIPKQCGRVWLFYLAKVEQVYKSQSEICNALSPQTRKAKTTRRNPLGDIYEPNPSSLCDDPFDAAHYHPPMIGHSHHQEQSDDKWLKDIEFHHKKFGRRPPAIAAKPQLTFLWQTPLLFVDPDKHARNQTWSSMAELLDSLRMAD